MKWLNFASILGPAILSCIPGLAPLAPLVVFGIQQAEQLPGATSADKQAHAINIARAGVAGVNAIAKKTVLDPTTADATIAAAVNTVVSVTNLVHQAHAPTPTA